jgi:rubrerythrin
MTAIEFAKKMETDAIKFYGEASNRTRHPVGKKMFLTVMEDEKRHLEMLNRLLRGLDMDTTGLSNPINTVKTVFEQMKDEMMQRISASNDEMEAFRVAMDMEREGADLYKKTASESASDREKVLFERLAFEEERHFSIFSNTYSFMKDTGNWFLWDEKGIVEG